MSLGIHFMLIWIAFTVCGVLGLTAALVWAIRSGQFAHQDRARYLALQSRIEGGEDIGPDRFTAENAESAEENINDFSRLYRIRSPL